MLPEELVTVTQLLSKSLDSFCSVLMYHLRPPLPFPFLLSTIVYVNHHLHLICCCLNFNIPHSSCRFLGHCVLLLCWRPQNHDTHTSRVRTSSIIPFSLPLFFFFSLMLCIRFHDKHFQFCFFKDGSYGKHQNPVQRVGQTFGKYYIGWTNNNFILCLFGVRTFRNHWLGGQGSIPVRVFFLLTGNLSTIIS